MGKNKKKQEPAKPPIPADLTSGYPHGTIITRNGKSQAPSVPAKELEETTPPLNEAELEHLDAVTREDKPLDLKPAQPVSVKCSECGEKRTYKLSQLPKTSDGAFIVGDLQCVRCLAPAGVNIEGPVL